MLKWGSTEVTAVKWGSTTCTAVYWGSTKVFPTFIICTVTAPAFNTKSYISCDGVGTVDSNYSTATSKSAEITDFTTRMSCYFRFIGRRIYVTHTGLTDPSTGTNSNIGYSSGTLYFYYTKGVNANISCWLEDTDD